MEYNQNIKTPTLCLNMIVKNESKIILRLLESVVNIIDCYCICDTGSTDNTIDIIETYFQSKNISGIIVYEQFVNFAHNRNFSLKSCLGMSDFVLLLDADMVLQVNKFDKNILKTGDCFYILQGNDDFYYQNMRIIQNRSNYHYIGVTHEYMSTPPNIKIGKIQKNILFIADHGDGGSKQNKYERDINLLLNGLIEEPNNGRYYFYLANSYNDSGKMDEAIEAYKKRIEIGGWDQEVWYSYYRIGLCYKHMGKMENAIFYWMEAYDHLPKRVENLYEIINYYRIKSKHKLSKVFYLLAKDSIKNATDKDEYLFLHNDIYTYKVDYEFTIIAAYLGIKDINNEVITVLNNSNDNSLNSNLLQNMKFYHNILKSSNVINFTDAVIKNINGGLVKFNSSSSCLIPNDGAGYMMNVRYVNYNITNTGSYLDCDNHIITLNKYVELDNKLNIVSQKWIDYEFEERRYVGVEDVRIYNETQNNNKLLKMIGTGYHKNNTIGIVSGIYDKDSNTFLFNEVTPSFCNSDCEKNWVFVDYKKETHVIYKWFPLQICKIDETLNKLNIVTSKQMPNIFKNVRGSTCGYKYVKTINLDENSSNITITMDEIEIWFVVHIVSYESPRHYYHMFVVFDENMNLLRYSAPFKFEGQPIEYCLSVVVEDERVLVNYSEWDKSTKIGVYDKKYIDSIIKYN